MTDSVQAAREEEPLWISLVLNECAPEERSAALSRLEGTEEGRRESMLIRRMTAFLSHIPEGAPLEQTLLTSECPPTPPLSPELAAKLKSIALDERSNVLEPGKDSPRQATPSRAPLFLVFSRLLKALPRLHRGKNSVFAGSLVAVALVFFVVRPLSWNGTSVHEGGLEPGEMMPGGAPPDEDFVVKGHGIYDGENGGLGGFDVHFLTRYDAEEPIQLLRPRLLEGGEEVYLVSEGATILLVMSGDVPGNEKGLVRMTVELVPDDPSKTPSSTLLLHEEVLLTEVPRMDGYFTNVDVLRFRIDQTPGFYRLIIKISDGGSPFGVDAFEDEENKLRVHSLELKIVER